jgi:uncharacterized protein
MEIDLTALGEGETHWSKEAAPEELALNYIKYDFADPVTVDLKINYTENQYILRGQITTQAQTQCVKCLESFYLHLDAEVGWAVQEVSDPQEFADQEATEDFWFIERGQTQIDITSRVREIILVGLPDNPVCRSDCRGLCAHCGKNLNDGPCDCRETKIDSRWGPLKDLLKGQDDSSGN